MIDLEKVGHARDYIEKLANGINPINNNAVAETDVINNVHISRCHFYVSDLLRQIIENKGICNNKTKKLPFNITAEEISRFNFSQEPIPISEIVKRINLLIDTEVYEKLKYKTVADWLIKIGLLKEMTDAGGKTVKRSTAQGNEIGIVEENRIGHYGQYTVVIYNREAQQFIIDNISAFIR